MRLQSQKKYQRTTCTICKYFNNLYLLLSHGLYYQNKLNGLMVTINCSSKIEPLISRFRFWYRPWFSFFCFSFLFRFEPLGVPFSFFIYLFIFWGWGGLCTGLLFACLWSAFLLDSTCLLWGSIFSQTKLS